MSKLNPAPLGIDLGSWTSKIGVAKRGGVELITNEANFRETPSVVGYGPSERQIGENGNIKMKSNFRDTIVSPLRFIGLPDNYPQLRQQTKFSPARSNTAEGRLQFEVNYQGEKQQLLPQQILGAFFNKLKAIMRRNQFEDKEAVLSVPAYLSQTERQAVLDAAKVAQFNVVRLINDSSAIALDYGMFRKSELEADNARNVLFIDFGHSKLTTFVGSFKKDEMSIIEQQFDRHLGCRDIDYQMLKFYKQVFEKSSGCDIFENRKAVVKLMENIEKQRKILTGIKEHDFNLEYLMEQNDLHYTLTREKFEELAKPILEKIELVLQRINSHVEKKKIQLHSIELVGGGSRIPAFIEIVKNIFKMEPSRTLNSSESVARGCTLQAAIKSPLFKVQQYVLHERVNHSVRMSWNFITDGKQLKLNSEDYIEKQSKFIFEKGDLVPTSKTVKFKKKEPIEILFEYENPPFSNNRFIGYYVTPAQKPKQQDFGVSFKVKFTENGLVTFQQCNLVEEHTQQIKVPKKKQVKKEEKKDQKKEGENKQGEPKAEAEMKPEEQEFEIKKKKKTTHAPIAFEAEQFRINQPKAIQYFFTAESAMENKDRLIIDTYEKKNELESTTYTWKDRLTSGNYREYIKEEEIPPIIAMLESINEWLYGEGQHAARGQYTQKLDQIHNKLKATNDRYNNFNNIIHELHNLAGCLQGNFEHLNSLDKKYEHITPEERQAGLTQIQSIKAWVHQSETNQSKRPKYENPVISVKEIQDKQKQINDAVRKIMSKPAPKKQQPKKEELKKGDPGKPDMDVESQAKKQPEMEAQK